MYLNLRTLRRQSPPSPQGNLKFQPYLGFSDANLRFYLQSYLAAHYTVYILRYFFTSNCSNPTAYSDRPHALASGMVNFEVLLHCINIFSCSTLTPLGGISIWKYKTRLNARRLMRRSV